MHTLMRCHYIGEVTHVRPTFKRLHTQTHMYSGVIKVHLSVQFGVFTPARLVNNQTPNSTEDVNAEPLQYDQLCMLNP